ncbi:hypothetical protein KCU95_g17136, partial [Aureobasidium melanogenum]
MDKVYEFKGGFVVQLEHLSMMEGSNFERGLELRNNFLNHCTGLRELELDRGDLLSAVVLVHLSGLASLQDLSISHQIRDDVGMQLQERISDRTSSSRPFPHIKIMSLCGGNLAIMPFLSSTPTTLVGLSLEVDDHRNSICPALSRLSNLVHLRLQFMHDRKLSRTDLDSISRLSKLQSCSIAESQPFRNDEFSIECSWITDSYFKSWIAKLPLLHTLWLEFDNPPLTQASLQYIAQSCPFLSWCHLMWVHDLNAWRTLEAPSFPKLSYLFLKGVQGNGYGQDQAMIDEHALRDVKMIRDLAPNLCFFSIRSRLQHEEALMAIFEAGI